MSEVRYGGGGYLEIPQQKAIPSGARMDCDLRTVRAYGWPNQGSIQPEIGRISFPASENEESQTFPESSNSELSPNSLLDQLKNPPQDKKAHRRLILDTEVLSFSPEQIPDLLTALQGFIEENRDSNDPEDLVAVRSAIRKHVAVMRAENLGWIASLLDPNHRTPVSLETELELAKMVVRKLTAVPPDRPDPEPDLAARLMDLARTYLNPRLLPRQFHGAIALDSALALVLLRSSHVPELFDVLKGLRLSWFKQLVGRGAQRINKELSSRFPGSQCKEYLVNLETLMQVVRE